MNQDKYLEVCIDGFSMCIVAKRIAIVRFNGENVNRNETTKRMYCWL